ncbi:MAG: sugar phosphate isomerase/epimerase family protein [Gemmataceae bacterium]
MTMPHTRRRFLQAAVAAVAATPAIAIEPIRRSGPPRFTLSLAAYSFHRLLDLKAKKPKMTLEEFIDFTAKQELSAIELTGYYFRETTDAYLKAIKARCDRHGLAVSGTAVGNDFCHTDKKLLAAQMDLVKRWVEHTALLGGKTIRIFAGSVKKGDTEAAARQRAIDAMQQACEFAAKHKVFLALENHGGITATPEQLLGLVRPIKSDWFGVNLDSGNFHTADPYGDLEKIAPYAVVAQLKAEIFPNNRRQDADFGRLVGILRKVRFQGYVALEYEAAEDPFTAVPRHLETLKKLLA